MNDITITQILEWTDSEGGEHHVRKESEGSILDITSTFSTAQENLGKLESYINRLIAKGDETKLD